MNIKTNAAESPAEESALIQSPQFSVVEPSTPAPVRRVNLGKLSTAAKPTSKYPILPDPTGVIATAVDQYIGQFATFEAIEGSLKSLKAEFGEWARPFYYEACAGRAEIPSSVMALSPESQVLLTFQDRYPSVDPDWTQLGEILGDKLPQTIAETFDVKIDGAKIPAANQQPLIEELSALFEKHNAGAAVTAKLKVKPIPGFHVARHRILTPEQNRALDAICPCVMSVKTKGVRR